MNSVYRVNKHVFFGYDGRNMGFSQTPHPGSASGILLANSSTLELVKDRA